MPIQEFMDDLIPLPIKFFIVSAIPPILSINDKIVLSYEIKFPISKSGELSKTIQD